MPPTIGVAVSWGISKGLLALTGKYQRPRSRINSLTSLSELGAFILRGGFERFATCFLSPLSCYTKDLV